MRHKRGEEGNPLRIKEEVKVASYLRLVSVVWVGYVVFEHVLCAVTPGSPHEQGTKEPIKEPCKLGRAPPKKGPAHWLWLWPCLGAQPPGCWW